MASRLLLKNLVPVPGTHKALPQSIFRAGVQMFNKSTNSRVSDPLRFVSSLDNPKHTCSIKQGDATYVLSTLEQAQRILQESGDQDERPVGISLFSKYSSIMRLNMVKHVYYLPAIFGRLPEFFNLVEDGVPFHYLLNPSAPMTEISVVHKEYEKISAIAPVEQSESHDKYIEFLDNLPAGSITPWRKVPLFDSDQAKSDLSFVREYGEVLKPTKNILRTLFRDIINSVPDDVLPIIEMCRDRALMLFDVYESTIDEDQKDIIGMEITRIFDVARNTAVTFSSFSTPCPAPRSYSSSAPHAYSPIFRHTPSGVRMYSTYVQRDHNPITLLSPDVIKEFREYFLHLWREQGEDDEKAVDLAGQVYRLSFFIQKIDQCGVFGKTPCPHEGGWQW